MPMTRIILASASPRRVELLRSFGLNFEILPSQADELHDESLTAMELCKINALRKAEQVARSHPDAVVLGADTLVTRNGTHYGKPRDLEDATRMLNELSGRTHQVITAVCLLHVAQNRRELFVDETLVTFKPLSPEIIRSYIQLVPVLDKAGAYGIQERGELLVERVQGSLNNVIGLPTEKLADAFSRWGLLSPRERDKIADSPPRNPEI